MSANLNEPAAAASTPAFGPFAPAIEYMVDSTQRNVLLWDVMRQRGNQYHEHMAKDAPHVLSYEAEIVIDGRTLERPVNYALARIIPPKRVDIDQRRRPFVVVDPRAGHGPGIGGFKADSEVGVALKAGHECYFIGFTPEGQLVLDRAQRLVRDFEALRQDISVLKRALAGHRNQPFAVPEGVTFVEIDKETGGRAGPFCEQRFNEAFLVGTEPQSLCLTHLGFPGGSLTNTPQLLQMPAGPTLPTPPVPD